MLKSQEITTESSPRKKCSSTFSLQLSLLVLFVLVLALFITGVSLDVMKNYHEAFYEYNYRKTNQYYDYLPTLEKSSSPNNLRLDEQWDLDTLPSEKESSAKKISLDDEWDLQPLKNFPMKKVKRGYFLDYHIPWVIKLPRNYILDPDKKDLNYVFTKQGRLINSLKKQSMANDKDDMYNHIFHLFPFRSPSKKSNVNIKRSTDRRWLLKPTKTFLPMSNEVVNILNSRNKQLMIAHIQASDDLVFLHQLYHFLRHYPFIPKNQNTSQEEVKLIRKRHSSFLPEYVGKFRKYLLVTATPFKQDIDYSGGYNRNEKTKQMKWVLYRNFPSLIINPSTDKINLESLINNSDSMNKGGGEIESEQRKRRDIERRDDERFKREFNGILQNMRKSSQSSVDRLRLREVLRLT